MPNEDYVQERWNLDDLFPALDSTEIEDAIKELEAQVAIFEEFRDRLSADMGAETFNEALSYVPVDLAAWVLRVSQVHRRHARSGSPDLPGSHASARG
jgi:hypothetical protein